MSLSNPTLNEIVKKHYFYKIRSHRSILISLLLIQILGILLSSFAGEYSSGIALQNYIEINYSVFSNSIIFILTLFWAFAASIHLTNKSHRYEIFTFVTNRLSNQISNILLLITLSLIGGATVITAGCTTRLIIFYKYNSNVIATSSLEYITGIIAASLYILLISALGYLIGTLVQLHKSFLLIIPSLYVGIVTFGSSKIVSWLEFLYRGIVEEPSLLLFAFKIMLLVFIFFAISVDIQNRLEVRR